LETIQNENGTHSMYRVDVKSGQFTPLLTFDSSPKHGTNGPLSPDDHTLYVASEDSVFAFDLQSAQEKTVFKLPGTQKLAPGGWALSADGRKLALMTLDDKDVFTLVTVSVNGIGYRELFSAPNTFNSRLTWTKDNKAILFSSLVKDT